MAVVVRLGLVRLVLAVTVGLGRVRQGKAVKVWCVRSRSGWTRLGGHGEARHGSAEYGEAVRVGLGEVRLAWLGVARRSWLGVARRGGSLGGLGEVCCVRATLGLSGRSWCVLACCGNARQQRECGGRGNSPLCGQGGLGGVCFCASGCGSFGLGEAVAVRLVAAGSG
jgi:hypothetical protein